MALFGWGFAFYGHAVYLAELQRLHGWPTSVVAGGSTLCYLAGAVLVAFVGDAMARLGPLRLVCGGIACMAVATATMPFVTAPWQLYAVYLVMAVAWASLGLGSITNLLGLWFRERRGLAISVALNGASVSGILIAPALVFMSATAGFTTAMLTVTAAMILLLLPLALLWLRGTPPHRVPAPAPEALVAVSPPSQQRWTKRQALRDFRFWSVCAPFALALTAQVGFIVHQIAFLSPLIGRAGAGWAVAITTAMAVAGRVGLGFVIDRLNQRLASAASFASQALALAAMAFTENPVLLLLACAVFGFSVGNLITFPALIIQREFDAASFGTLTALTIAVCQFTYAFGPGLLGMVRDATGGYAAALFLCVALKLLATAAILIRVRT
jgi:MFS family permease